MDPERWRRINELFQAAVEREPAERSGFLADACLGDGELRSEIESLLAAHERAGDFIETPAVRPSAPALLPGRRLGPYEIVSFLGEGGMGRVYRARDARLAREVAVKVLDPAWAADPDLLSRFRNEARAVSALSHGNIVVVHDVGEADGIPFFAMELLEGPTLREVLGQGRAPLRKALEIASQVAEGLAAAHARGVVHRDLKPENVMITKSGVAKILDFGLAKLRSPQAKDPGPGASSAVTHPGMLLGTAGYMSPEQATGRPVDFRTDQFAFGAILYELLSGRRAFRCATDVETLAAIIRDEPEPLPPAEANLPVPLRFILARCLAKDPEDRYASTRDLARDVAQLRDWLSQPSLAAQVAVAPPARRRGWAWAGALAATLAAGAAIPLLLRPREQDPPRLRSLTYSGADSFPAASPDGGTIAFTSSRDGTSRIWLKQVSTGAEVALTEGPDGHPRFSADGSSVLFARMAASGPSLYRVSALGGAPRKVLDDARAGDWSPDGKRLAFVRSVREPGTRPVYLVGVAAADGSGPRIVETIEAQEVSPPRWSRDSKRIALAHGYGAALVWSFLVLDPDGSERRVLHPPYVLGAVSAPAWSNSGALLYAQSDAVDGTPSGRLVLQEVRSGRARILLRALALGGGSVDLAGSGRAVVTLQRVRGNLREIPLSDPSAARWLARGDCDDRQPFYSPDGARVVFSSNRDGQLDVWDVSPKTGSVRRLTDHASEDWDPRVAPDGRLFWSSKRSGSFEVWTAEGDGSAPRQVSHDGVDAENPTFTPDLAWIVYASSNPARRGLWKVRLDGTGATQLASGNLGLPEVSPDGALVLFGSYGDPHPVLQVVRLADGASVPFEIRIRSTGLRTESAFIRGRSRWMPDGRSIAFVDADESGRSGVFLQDFTPGKDTSATRRPLAGFHPDAITESFGISPDGTRIAIALKERSSHILLAEGLESLGQ